MSEYLSKTSKISKKKKASVALLAVGAMAIGGTAYAYWTSTGAGTGSAQTGSTTTALVVVQTSNVSNMHPGDTAQSLSGNFTNDDASPIYVKTVTVRIASVTLDPLILTGTCTADDFTLENKVMTVGKEIPSGTEQGTWSGATIKFNNTDTNQDACKGAVVNFAYLVG